MYYETASYTVEAIQYNGSNLHEIKEILLRQKPSGRVTITGLKIPFIRQLNRPDQPLLRGDWIALDIPDYWAHHISDELFSRSFKR